MEASDSPTEGTPAARKASEKQPASSNGMQITVPASDKQLSTSTPDVELSPATSPTHSAVSFSDANLSAQTDNLPCAESSLTPPEVVRDHGDLVASLNADGILCRECKSKPSKSRDSGTLFRRYRSYSLERRKASVNDDICLPRMRREAHIQALNYESLRNVQSILAAEILAEFHIPKEIDNNFPSSESA
ncbi:unnamed protein product [Clonostachys rosea f. rosea IK726]|uniref:Uncharacterized protein n=2 Tax=Bionectria ochroleuca TaxID=29856 RepID=A0A0B7KJ00_BIOOC|nr:unnamed protein product [Clonostachys rosea f. rosea IK726]